MIMRRICIPILPFRAECQENINKFPGAMFKKFNTEDEARKYIEEKQRKPSTRNAKLPPAAQPSSGTWKIFH